MNFLRLYQTFLDDVPSPVTLLLFFLGYSISYSRRAHGILFQLFATLAYLFQSILKKKMKTDTLKIRTKLISFQALRSQEVSISRIDVGKENIVKGTTIGRFICSEAQVAFNK